MGNTVSRNSKNKKYYAYEKMNSWIQRAYSSKDFSHLITPRTDSEANSMQA